MAFIENMQEVWDPIGTLRKALGDDQSLIDLAVQLFDYPNHPIRHPYKERDNLRYTYFGPIWTRPRLSQCEMDDIIQDFKQKEEERIVYACFNIFAAISHVRAGRQIQRVVQRLRQLESMIKHSLDETVRYYQEYLLPPSFQDKIEYTVRVGYAGDWHINYNLAELRDSHKWVCFSRQTEIGAHLFAKHLEEKIKAKNPS